MAIPWTWVALKVALRLGRVAFSQNQFIHVLDRGDEHLVRGILRKEVAAGRENQQRDPRNPIFLMIRFHVSRFRKLRSD